MRTGKVAERNGNGREVGIMTEQDWLRGQDPRHMLQQLGGRASDRKLRLFVLHCCRAIQPMFQETRAMEILEVAQRYADDQCELGELEQFNVWVLAVAPFVYTGVIDQAMRAVSYLTEPRLTCRVVMEASSRAIRAEEMLAKREKAVDANQVGKRRRQTHCDWLRDLFGNPYRPVNFSPSWRTPAGIAIADSIYADEDFSDLPILADTLEEAGCSNEELLHHCRHETTHVLGCWVIDLLLNKT